MEDNIEYVKWLISTLEDKEYSQKEVQNMLLSVIGEIVRNG